VALLGAAFQIGRSALAAYQSAVAVTGQNIANVGNPDFTRQTGRLTALHGGPTLGGARPGAGVALSQIRRHADEALEARLRDQLGARSSAAALYGSLSRTESLYNELTGQDLSSLLSEFFATVSALQTSPSDSTARDLVVASADSLTDTLARIREGLTRQARDLNDEVAAGADQVTALGAEIASLNVEVVRLESDGVTVAGALRDRRDALLRDLSELVDIQTRERDNGAVNVYLGSEPLVQFDRSRGLAIERTLVDGLETSALRFADNGASVLLRGGQLHGVVEARDVQLRDQLNRLDQLAGALIYEVNRIHADGVGLVGYSASLGAYSVVDPDAALNSAQADLNFPVQNGSFIVRVRDRNSGQVTSRLIEVDLDGLGADMSLNDLADALNGVPGLRAEVTADNRLKLDADQGAEFWFNEDSSGAIAALGAAPFFTGVNASDIEVAGTLRNDRRLIAASLSGETFDGGNAGRLADLASTRAGSALLSGRSIGDFHAAMITDLAVRTASAEHSAEAADAVFQSLYAQREAISGVNLDEEAINLTKFERAYQGAARYLTVLDDLSNEVLALV